MKAKLLPLFAGILALGVVAAPLTAQACNGSNKDQGASSESELPEETSVIEEAN